MTSNAGQADFDGDGFGDACDSDDDGDGVLDAVDSFPFSDMSPTVVIGGCDSGVMNRVLPTGATFADLIAQVADSARNHGAFVSKVALLTNAWRNAGFITGREKASIQACSAHTRWSWLPWPW